MKRVAIVGFGAIGASVAGNLLRNGQTGATLDAICVRPAQAARCRQMVPDRVMVSTDLQEVLARRPDILIEAAGHAAVLSAGAPALRQGCDVWVLSVGALADEGAQRALTEQAQAGGAHILIPSGALAGFDGLLSLRESGLNAVTYTSTKPPAAWRGTAGEALCDLDNLAASVCLLDGTAREAALKYPRNANLAAAVAIAGIGFDHTRVRLVADPGARANTGHLIAEAASARLELTLAGAGFGSNPKTSEITGMSVVAALSNAAAAIRFV